jgi:hypothetical protein
LDKKFTNTKTNITSFKISVVCDKWFPHSIQKDWNKTKVRYARIKKRYEQIPNPNPEVCKNNERYARKGMQKRVYFKKWGMPNKKDFYDANK